jgi:hypothetical protein
VGIARSSAAHAPSGLPHGPSPAHHRQTPGLVAITRPCAVSVRHRCSRTPAQELAGAEPRWPVKASLPLHRQAESDGDQEPLPSGDSLAWGAFLSGKPSSRDSSQATLHRPIGGFEPPVTSRSGGIIPIRLQGRDGSGYTGAMTAADDRFERRSCPSWCQTMHADWDIDPTGHDGPRWGRAHR